MYIDKKKKIIIVSCIAVIILLSLFFINKNQKTPEIPKQLEGKEYILKYKDNSILLNISSFNKELKFDNDENSIEWTHNDNFCRIMPYGFCLGENMTSLQQACLYNKEVYLHATDRLNPNNGIAEGYIVFKVNKRTDEIRVTIFVDQDWKNNVRPTNIVWGENFTNIRPFKFYSVSKGIWYDSINLNFSKYMKSCEEKNNNFPLFVGSLNLEELNKMKNVKTEDELRNINIEVEGLFFS